jgi:arginine repressor
MTKDEFKNIFERDSKTFVGSQIQYLKKINAEFGTNYSQSSLSRRLEDCDYKIKNGWLIPPATEIDKIRMELLTILENEGCNYLLISEHLLFININNGYGSRIKHLFKKAFDNIVISIFTDDNDNLLIIISVNFDDSDIKRLFESSKKFLKLNTDSSI